MKPLCLILEGGGAKNSFQYGVLKVLTKAGYKFNAASGASFGAINAALFVEGGMKKVEEFWKEFDAKSLFGEEALNTIFDQIYRKEEVDTSLVSGMMSLFKDSLTFIEAANTRYNMFFNKYIDEASIRNSKMNYGLVVTKVPPFCKDVFLGGIGDKNPFELFSSVVKAGGTNRFIDNFEYSGLDLVKDEIPKGKLADYVIASASLIPPCYPKELDGNYYVDGGYFDNTPIAMMKMRGYKDFIVIKTNPLDVNLDDDLYKDINVKFIAPDYDLGSCAMFSKENMDNIYELGINKGKEFIEKEHGIFTKLKVRNIK